jgi:hypothetical protein
VTRLRQMMLDELQCQNYSPGTISSYISAVEDLPDTSAGDHTGLADQHSYACRSFDLGARRVRSLSCCRLPLVCPECRHGSHRQRLSPADFRPHE